MTRTTPYTAGTHVCSFWGLGKISGYRASDNQYMVRMHPDNFFKWIPGHELWPVGKSRTPIYHNPLTSAPCEPPEDDYGETPDELLY